MSAVHTAPFCSIRGENNRAAPLHSHYDRCSSVDLPDSRPDTVHTPDSRLISALSRLLNKNHVTCVDSLSLYEKITDQNMKKVISNKTKSKYFYNFTTNTKQEHYFYESFFFIQLKSKFQLI
uniref:Uncharacterized protein n=1 Tax=Pyxicephalus adspersus TaxID=30357 RepID=A0AAV3ACD6_PYXAD|nr:TPA: hypothetical protein GDO54_017684 [Pyxicephalus adspersus]